jgi:hypothetical protein
MLDVGCSPWIFCGLLPYTGPAEEADTYTHSRERHVEVDGEFADAVLGCFQKGREQFVGVLEGKGARDPLEGSFAGRLTSSRARLPFRKSKCEQRFIEN